jgi:hypothetical protein
VSGDYRSVDGLDCPIRRDAFVAVVVGRVDVFDAGVAGFADGTTRETPPAKTVDIRARGGHGRGLS